MSDDKAGRDSRNAAPADSHSDAPRSVSLSHNSIDSRELFQAGREITITHGDDTYRLRLTAQNKLILTK